MDWLLHPRRRLFADALVVTWVVVWALAGYTAGRALDKLSEVTRSAEGASTAVIHTGESIRDVDVPVVGAVFKTPGEQVIRAGRTARAQARAGSTKVHRASVLFGLLVWLVPTLPLLLLYSPLRMAAARETRALRARCCATTPATRSWTSCSRSAPSRTCRITVCARSVRPASATACWRTRSWRARGSGALRPRGARGRRGRARAARTRRPRSAAARRPRGRRPPPRCGRPGRRAGARRRRGSSRGASSRR